MSVVIYLFRTGMEYLNLHAAAIGFVLFGMTFVLSWIQLNLMGAFEEKSKCFLRIVNK